MANYEESPAEEQEAAGSKHDVSSLTQIYEGPDSTTAIRVRTMSRALNHIDVCDDSIGTVALLRLEPVRTALIDAAKRRRVHVRFITEITPENLSPCKEILDFATLRHIDGLKGNFVVTEGEYYAFAALKDSRAPMQTIYSRAKTIVEQQQYIFDALWERAVPAEERINEIQNGFTKPRIEVISSAQEIQKKYSELIESAREEIMLVLPTVEAFHREESIGAINSIENCAERGVKVRVLTPYDDRIRKTIEAIAEAKQGSRIRFEFRSIARPGLPNTVTLLIVDNEVSFTVEQRDNTKEQFLDAVGLGTFSTSKPYVRSQSTFFETLWIESELRQREADARRHEERALRRAELLQDIVTHDLRNYLQVAKLGLDMLTKAGEDGAQPQPSKEILEYVLEAVDDSSDLIERTKKLGKIFSQKNIVLEPVALLPSIETSLELVRKTHPHKFVNATRNYDMNATYLPDGTAAIALADDLLGEVFVNIFSNSVKYTEGDRVDLDIRVEKVPAKNHEGGLRAPRREPPGASFEAYYWKVAVSDTGKGIPLEVRPHLFDRYLTNAKGSGLGMSIIHALVVERYRGKLSVTDRVNDDYTKGTVIGVYLPCQR